jgi:hypothetical protein
MQNPYASLNRAERSANPAAPADGWRRTLSRHSVRRWQYGSEGNPKWKETVSRQR